MAPGQLGWHLVFQTASTGNRCPIWEIRLGCPILHPHKATGYPPERAAAPHQQVWSGRLSMILRKVGCGAVFVKVASLIWSYTTFSLVASASPGNLLEMQNSQALPQTDLSRKLWGWGSAMCFRNTPGWCSLNMENLYLTPEIQASSCCKLTSAGWHWGRSFPAGMDVSSRRLLGSAFEVDSTQNCLWNSLSWENQADIIRGPCHAATWYYRVSSFCWDPRQLSRLDSDLYMRFWASEELLGPPEFGILNCRLWGARGASIAGWRIGFHA